MERKPGSALVFGRIRATCPGCGGELRPFSRDPMDHMLPPDPLFTLELRRFRSPGGAVRYASSPAPEVEGDGSFYWILPEGDYALASNPRPYGSSRFDPDETTVLARFAVPAGAGTLYAGTLEIIIAIGQQELIDSWRGRETLYTVSRVTVADEREPADRALGARFPSVPGPRATVLMRPGPE